MLTLDHEDVQVFHTIPSASVPVETSRSKNTVKINISMLWVSVSHPLQTKAGSPLRVLSDFLLVHLGSNSMPPLKSQA